LRPKQSKNENKNKVPMKLIKSENNQDNRKDEKESSNKINQIDLTKKKKVRQMRT
jgi:hypothetical protein